MLQIDQISLHLPQGYLFEEISFQVNEKERIGLVGKNGAGKSTLLKIIDGKVTPSSGKVASAKDYTIGYLEQHLNVEDEVVFDQVYASNKEIFGLEKRIEAINVEIAQREDYESDSYMALLDELNDKNMKLSVLDGFGYKERVVQVLKGLGFDDKTQLKKSSELSGGWQMRIELAKLLVNDYDLLLLDEPTNHLDIVSLYWFEDYLKTFEGSVIVISHDRKFLDNVTKRTIEIINGKIYDENFGYSKFVEKRKEQIELQKQSKKQQEKEVKKTQELIDKFRAKKNKAAFAQSLIKKLDRMEEVQVDDWQERGFNVNFPVDVQSGKVVATLKDIEKSFGDKNVFNPFDLYINKHDRIALVGPNGAGKSTFIKILTDSLDYSGTVELGHNVSLGYFAQDAADQLDTSKTVLETVDDVAKGDFRKNIRGLLGAFLFSGEDVDKKVEVLSGGEKTRLALCRLLLQPCNFLILDEPTNHLDIASKNVLKSALKNYEGTSIVVSHDREFLEDLADRTLVIQDHMVKEWLYSIPEYLDHELAKINAAQIQEKRVEKATKTKEEKKSSLSSKDEYQLKKKLRAIENKMKSTEEKMKEKEASLSKLGNEDFEAYEKANKEYGVLREEYVALEEEWEELFLTLEA